MFTVYDFLNLCTDDFATITICDLANGDANDVFCDTMHKAMWSDFADYTVMSFDFYKGKITLNIDTSEA